MVYEKLVVIIRRGHEKCTCGLAVVLYMGGRLTSSSHQIVPGDPWWLNLDSSLIIINCANVSFTMSELKSVNKNLTPTQARVVKAKVEADIAGKTITEVAPAVFPDAKTTESARSSMHQVLQNITVQEAIQTALAEAGLTVDKLAGVVVDAMDATKTVIIRDKATTPEEADNSAFADEVPDHGIRLKAAGMAAQWMGIGKGAEGGAVNFNFINVSKADKGEYGV